MFLQKIEISTFHEAIRLAVCEPKSTEEAQYSTSYSCAVALVKGNVGVNEVSDKFLNNLEVIRISRSLKMIENDYCNSQFPEQRYASAELYLKDGKQLKSDFINPRWTADVPPKKVELTSKFFNFSKNIICLDRAKKIEKATRKLIKDGSLEDLLDLLYLPIEKRKAD